MGEQVGARSSWGCSSVGRAPALQAGGQEFESLHLHLRIKSDGSDADIHRLRAICECRAVTLWVFNKSPMCKQASDVLLLRTRITCSSRMYLENCISETHQAVNHRKEKIYRFQ